MRKIKIKVLNPTVPEAKKLTKEDVWGTWDPVANKRTSEGMIVARFESKCSIFDDIIPYKSVTVVGPAIQKEEIIYWLEYVHGGNSVSRMRHLPGGKIAIRSDYQAW
jgi:hypothetical protein